jgi:hypothetical protein
MERTQKDAVLDAGLAAVGLAGDEVHMTGVGRLPAPSGPLAVAAGPEHDGLPDPGWDGLGVALVCILYL